MPRTLKALLTLALAAALLASVAVGPANAARRHTLRYQLDHTRTCAALKRNISFILASTIRRVDGTTRVGFHRARLVCGGEDDMHWVARGPLLHAGVNAPAEVVVVNLAAQEHSSTAKRLPGVFSRQQHAFQVFAVRRSSPGHFSAIAERFTP